MTNTEKQVRNAIAKGLANGTGEAKIFFRADDIGVPSKQCSQLIQLFLNHRLPLCLAVVPTWVTKDRFATLLKQAGNMNPQWCWHQHGWLHKNHETIGKKQEFGPGRAAAAQVSDLQKGQLRLQEILGDEFSPFFTPPWNRCSLDTLNGLQKLGFTAISRSKNAKPPSPAQFPDIQINIDLHTRKETEPEKSLHNMLSELTQEIANGTGGIMIHHQRMNQAAFDFLVLLLGIISHEPNLHPVLFQDLC